MTDVAIQDWIGPDVEAIHTEVFKSARGEGYGGTAGWSTCQSGLDDSEYFSARVYVFDFR